MGGEVNIIWRRGLLLRDVDTWVILHGEVGRKGILLLNMINQYLLFHQMWVLDLHFIDRSSDIGSFFFLSRLQLYELVEHKVQGDGNCQVCFPFRMVDSCMQKFKYDSYFRFSLFSWFVTWFDCHVFGEKIV